MKTSCFKILGFQLGKQVFFAFFTVLLFTGQLFSQKITDKKLAEPKSQFRLLKRSTCKVDPASFLVNEFRVWYQQRLKNNYFWFISPYGFRWYSPKFYQKISGVGMRMGLEKFLFTDDSPRGFFLRAGGHARLRSVNLLDEAYLSKNKFFTTSAGGLFCFGRQWIFSPWKDMIWGLSGGVEYLFNFYNSDRTNLPQKAWYQIPILNMGNELRALITLEVGFTFRENRRHW